MNFSVRLSAFISLLFCASASAQDSLLPLPEGEVSFTDYSTPSEPVFLKPTKSIKPPTTPANGSLSAAAAPQVHAPTVARLRRLILMPGGLSPEMMREQMVASGLNRTPVTVVGMDAPAPVLTNLANFFGTDVNAETQKQLLETVRDGLGAKSKAPRRVEMVGWMPKEGVMAVAVYPES